MITTITSTITNSSMSCFKACPRMYYYSYEQCLRPAVTSKPLRIGTMVHEGLDIIAKGATIEQAIDVINTMYVERIIDLPEVYENELNMECVTVCCLLQGYAKAWANSGIEIVESETVFNLPILNENGNAMTSFRQEGKRDRIGKLPDGRTALMETKTVSEDISAGSDYRNILAINQQVSMYVLAAIQEGKQIDTTVYDCIRKPTIKPCDVAMTDDAGLKIVLDETGTRVLKANGEPRQTGDTAKGYTLQVRPMKPAEWSEKLTADIAERPEYYYQRFEVPRLQADLDEFQDELWQMAKTIGEFRNKNRWYRNTNNCKRYNSLCPYYDLCAGLKEFNGNDVPDGFRLAESAHEELQEN